jgi:hypothetical protein
LQSAKITDKGILLTFDEKVATASAITASAFEFVGESTVSGSSVDVNLTVNNNTVLIPKGYFTKMPSKGEYIIVAAGLFKDTDSESYNNTNDYYKQEIE